MTRVVERHSRKRGEAKRSHGGESLLLLSLALLLGGLVAHLVLAYCSPSFGESLGAYLQGFLAKEGGFSPPSFPRLSLAILPFPLLILLLGLGKNRRFFWFLLCLLRGLTWGLAIGLLAQGQGEGGIVLALLLLGGGMVLGLVSLFALVMGFGGERGINGGQKKGKSGEKERIEAKSYRHCALYAMALHYLWEGFLLPWLLGCVY